MPRLQILQHKSYHPYLEKNKEKVRKDEEKAAILQADLERQQLDSTQAARLDLLRNRPEDDTTSRATTSTLMPSEPSKLLARHRKTKDESHEDRIRKDARKEKAKLEFDWPDVEKRKAEKRALKEEENKKRDAEFGRSKDEELVEVGGGGRHINFWAGLEKDEALIPGAVLLNKPKPTPDQIQDDDPTTMYLNRPERETKPWYADAELRRHEERSDDKEIQAKRERRRWKEEASKSRNDPFALVQSALATSTRKPKSTYERPTPPSIAVSGSTALESARLIRESNERSRALALISETRRRQLAASSPATPSTVAGPADEYSNMWNAQEVREAQQRRDAVRGWAGNVHGDPRAQGWDDSRRRANDWTRDRSPRRENLRKTRYWEI